MNTTEILTEVANFIEQYPKCYFFYSNDTAKILNSNTGKGKYCILGLANALLDNPKKVRIINWIAKDLGFESEDAFYHELNKISSYWRKESSSAIQAIRQYVRQQGMKK